jgi:hypothetical protein
LHKQCPIHPKSKHTVFPCISLRKSLNAPIPDQDEKGKDDEERDKSGAQEYQDPKNVVDVIFSGDILSVEPAIQQPLRYSKVPISFSQDGQWTSFSELGKFLLVLDPVVANSQVTRVLIDGGSGLNLLFLSTLKRMG